MATAVSGGRTEELDPRAKSAIRGAFLGFFVDMFDIYLPVVVLAPALLYFVSPSLSDGAKSLAGGYVAAGIVSQRTGRRPFLIWTGALMAVAATFLYYLLLSAPPRSFFGIILLATAIAVLVVSPWGLATTYINERFQTGVRASGFGLGYSLAVIIPSFYAFFQSGLAAFMPSLYTVLILLVLGTLLIVGGAAWGPETKDVDFSDDSKTGKPTSSWRGE